MANEETDLILKACWGETGKKAVEQNRHGAQTLAISFLNEIAETHTGVHNTFDPHWIYAAVKGSTFSRNEGSAGRKVMEKVDALSILMEGSLPQKTLDFMLLITDAGMHEDVRLLQTHRSKSNRFQSAGFSERVSLKMLDLWFEERNLWIPFLDESTSASLLERYARNEKSLREDASSALAYLRSDMIIEAETDNELLQLVNIQGNEVAEDYFYRISHTPMGSRFSDKPANYDEWLDVFNQKGYVGLIKHIRLSISEESGGASKAASGFLPYELPLLRAYAEYKVQKNSLSVLDKKVLQAVLMGYTEKDKDFTYLRSTGHQITQMYGIRTNHVTLETAKNILLKGMSFDPEMMALSIIEEN